MTVYNFVIRGKAFYCRNKIRVGSKVLLVPEPNNKHDQRAVAAYIGGKMIGYVAKNQTHHYHNSVKYIPYDASVESDGKHDVLVRVKLTPL